MSAQSEGIGIRVIRDGRTGFAYAGTLDDDAVAEVLAEARDNVAVRHRPTSGPGWPSPTASPSTAQELWSDELAGDSHRRTRSLWPRSSSG